MANNILNHKDAVHRAILTFNDYEACNTVHLNNYKEDEDKDNLFLTRITLSMTYLIIVTLPKSATNNGVRP